MTREVKTGPSQILLVEDDDAVGRSLKEALEREGYAVKRARNAAEAKALANQARPSLFLLDVRLPDASGFDLCRALRAAGHREPIIMLTVERDEIDKVLGLELGADDYVTKPFALRELLARIRAQLRRAYGKLSEPGTVLFAGDLEVDLERRQVRCGGRPVDLTPTEFKLLTYLVSNKGYAVSRGQILNAVWDVDSSPEDERAVNVHVRRLREKIEREPERPTLLLTVPGVGYRLTDR